MCVCVCACVNSQTWQKRYLVLRDVWTGDNDSCLELYACSNADSAGNSQCHMVNLRHVMLVDVYHDSKSFPYAFIVFRSISVSLSISQSLVELSSLFKQTLLPKALGLVFIFRILY